VDITFPLLRGNKITPGKSMMIPESPNGSGKLEFIKKITYTY
jgi:hypothetical protein